MTNFEKLKALTIDELVYDMVKEDVCPPPYQDGWCPPKFEFDCTNCWHDWLNQEAK